MSCTFHYHDGNIVQIGDLVNTGNGTLGVVEEILDIGEDNSLQHNCPNGGADG